MSRPISFRGMDINGEWHYGLVAESAGFPRMPEKGVYISNMVGNPWAFQVRLETVGEYSGLQDKNGKKIYEGDILHISDGLRPQYVRWVQWMAGFAMAISETSGTTGIPEDCEIIGNIHENKELITND